MNLNRTLRVSLYFILALQAASTEDINDLETRVIGFENTRELSAWTATQDVETKTVPRCKEGHQGLSLRVKPFQQGGEPYPGVTIDLQALSLTDLSGYEYVLVDVYNEGTATATPSIVAVDRSGKKKFQPFSCTIVEWTTLAYAIPHTSLQTSSMKALQIYFSRPSGEARITIDNVRLVNTLPRRLNSLAETYDFFRQPEAAAIKALAVQASRGIGLREASDAYQTRKASLGALSRHVLRSDTRQLPSGENLCVAIADSMTRIFPHEQPILAQVRTQAALSAAKGEREALQVVVLAPPERKWNAVSVKTRPLGTVAPGSPTLSTYPVGFVKTGKARYPVEYTGWHPDPLLEGIEAVEVRENEAQSFWVLAEVPTNSRAGFYPFEIRVRADGETRTIPLVLEVWDFMVPLRGHLPTLTSVYNMPAFIPDEAAHDSIRMFLLDRYRFSFGNIYSGGGYGPKVNPLSPASPAAFEKYTKQGLADFNIGYLRLKRQILHPPGMTGEKSKIAWEGLSAEEKAGYPQTEKDRVKKILDQWVPELKRLGIYERAYCYGFDEAVGSEWPAMIDFWKTISNDYPDLKIYTTAVDPSLGLNSGLDFIKGFIVPFESYDFEASTKARERGVRVIPYNAKLCIDTPLIQQREILGFHAWRMGFGGYMVWNINRWYHLKERPSGAPYLRDENISRDFEEHNGWAMLFYPGYQPGTWLGSIRLENWRDGLEDFEYLYLLENALATLPPEARDIRMRIKDFLAKVLSSVPREAGQFLKSPQKHAALRTEAAALLHASGVR